MAFAFVSCVNRPKEFLGKNTEKYYSPGARGLADVSGSCPRVVRHVTRGCGGAQRPASRCGAAEPGRHWGSPFGSPHTQPATQTPHLVTQQQQSRVFRLGGLNCRLLCLNSKHRDHPRVRSTSTLVDVFFFLFFFFFWGCLKILFFLQVFGFPK